MGRTYFRLKEDQDTDMSDADRKAYLEVMGGGQNFTFKESGTTFLAELPDVHPGAILWVISYSSEPFDVS